MVRELHPYTEGEPVGVLATLLSAFSAAVGRGPHVGILLAKIKNHGTTTDLDNSLASLGDDLHTSVSRAGGGRPMHLYRFTEAAANRLNRSSAHPPTDQH